MSPPNGKEAGPLDGSRESRGKSLQGEPKRDNCSTPTSPAETLSKPTPEEIQRRRAVLRARAWGYLCDGSCPRTILQFYQALRMRQAREAGL